MYVVLEYSPLDKIWPLCVQWTFLQALPGGFFVVFCGISGGNFRHYCLTPGDPTACRTAHYDFPGGCVLVNPFGSATLKLTEYFDS